MTVMPAFRILVTGAGGFVGRHLVSALKARWGDACEIVSTSRYAEAGAHSCIALDVADRGSVQGALKEFRPTHVINLAGVAAPKKAGENPTVAWQTHFNGTLNLGYGILEHAPGCCLVTVGSGLCYGASATRGVPLNEDVPLQPTGVYETSKAAGDLAAGALALQGLRSVRLRPFNHTGAGQSDDFAAPSFAMQIARIEAGRSPPVLRVGNLDAERDFLDVLDVVDAYLAVIERSRDLQPGTVLNIASGQPVRIRRVLDLLLASSTRRDITVEMDPDRMRPAEIPYFVGDASAARRQLGWTPRRSLEETLAGLLNWCRAQV